MVDTYHFTLVQSHRIYTKSEPNGNKLWTTGANNVSIIHCNNVPLQWGMLLVGEAVCGGSETGSI